MQYRVNCQDCDFGWPTGGESVGFAAFAERVKDDHADETGHTVERVDIEVNESKSETADQEESPDA